MLYLACKGKLFSIDVQEKLYICKKNKPMPFWIIYIRLKKYRAMAIYPFLILKTKDLKHDKILMNHERIHFQQQFELAFIFFYLIYGLHYLYNYYKYKNHDLAYFNIVFEKEAYHNEKNLNYLKKRPLFNSFKYWYAKAKF